MLPRKFPVFFALLALIIPLIGSSALANKSAVSIQVPSAVQRGSEAVIRVTVTHDGNSFLHYTEWLSVAVNGKEVARWKYTASERPETQIFTKEIKFMANDDLEIKAEASCNIHGSAGPATVKVSVKDQ
jgi:desulfoferrodoxin (superoxide reductase-like protein)